MSAALYVAVTRRFAPDTDVRAITTYVTDVRSRYKDGKSLPPMDLEAMIRAALGEADLIDDLSPEAAFSAQLALLSALLDDANLSSKPSSGRPSGRRPSTRRSPHRGSHEEEISTAPYFPSRMRFVDRVPPVVNTDLAKRSKRHYRIP